MKNSILALCTLMILVIAGCSSSQQQASTAPIAQEAQQESKQTSSQDTSQPTGAAAQLQTLMAAKEKIEYQITYDITATVAGNEMKSTMIQYFDGANRMRTDVTVKGISESRTYVIDGAATSCTKVNSKWMCNAAEVPLDRVQSSEDAIAQGISSYAITQDGEKLLLGKSASCFKAADPANAATMRYCFSGDGIPVYISMETPQATTEMTALLYGKDVAETVWVIPT